MKIECVAALVGCGVVSFGAAAGVSQATLVAPGGYIQAGATTASAGTFAWPGVDLSNAFFGPISTYKEFVFAGDSLTHRTVQAIAPGVAMSAFGTSALGYTELDAVASFPSAAVRPGAAIDGGWSETLTITNPAHTGESGVVRFGVSVQAFLTAQGSNARSALRVAAFLNGVPLNQVAGFSAGESDVLPTTQQYGNWELVTDQPLADEFRIVRDEITLAVPFTFGTPFTLGLSCLASAGTRIETVAAGNSFAEAEDTRVNWGGFLGVTINGQAVTGNTLTSSTGKDFGPSIIPPSACPGDFNFDGVVDDEDFQIFAAGYNVLDCDDPAMTPGCPGDMDGNNIVDDEDFQIFVVAYNSVVCV